GAVVTSTWKKGAAIKGNGGGRLIFEGEVLEVDPPRRLVHTSIALWGEEVKAEGPSRVTWEITQVRDSCRLLVTHDQGRRGANEQLDGGWRLVLSGSKTLGGTGEILTTPGSLRWLEGDASQMAGVK